MNSFSSPSVVVLIPVYRAQLSKAEEVSLRQCLKVLGKYSIALVKPEGLSVDTIKQKFPQLTFESFPDHFFTGTDSYNKLLVSLNFYQRFQPFEYLLIYQLDAFVFRDDLPYWCAQKFDYLGAPTLHQDHYDNLPIEAKEEFARALSTQRIVFNGGLSLRRIAGMIRYLKIYHLLYPEWKGNEDMLFSLEATRLKPMKFFIRLPTWQQALRFAFEKSPLVSYELTNHVLPFGCHAWERYAPAFWKDFIPPSS